MARSFPELKYNDIKKIAKDYYEYMCDIAVEDIWTLSASEREICKMFAVDNREEIVRVKDKHRLVLVTMGHSGNWELMGALFGDSATRPDDSFSQSNCVLAYKHAHTSITDHLMHRMRMHKYKKFKKDGSVVDSKKIMRHILSNKENNTIYVLIADQNPSGKDKLIVDFLHQPTIMLGGPEFIATKLNVPVVFMHIYREERGRYKVRFTTLSEEPATLQSGELTSMYASELEKAINANKCNWLWTHKRWKRSITQEEKENYDRLLINKLKKEVGAENTDNID